MNVYKVFIQESVRINKMCKVIVSVSCKDNLLQIRIIMQSE